MIELAVTFKDSHKTIRFKINRYLIRENCLFLSNIDQEPVNDERFCNIPKGHTFVYSMLDISFIDIPCSVNKDPSYVR